MRYVVRSAWILALFLILLVVASCAPVTPAPSAPPAVQPTAAPVTQQPTAAPFAQATAAAPQPTTAPSAKADPNGKIVAAQTVDVTSLDPNSDTVVGTHNVLDNMFDFLIIRDRSGKFVPSLALSWQFVDPTTLKMTLRQGVKFHNGNPFTAADVKFTYDRIQTDKQLASKMSTNISTIAQTTVNDDYTVTFTTKAPDPILIERFTEVPIVNKATVEKMGLEAFAKAPVGTGPFKFVEWKKDQYVSMERNDDYWGGKAGIKTLIFRVIPEPATQVSELQTGGIDIAYQNITVDQIPQIQKAGNRVIGIPSSRLLYLMINMAKKPFDDVRVRQAVAYALNLDSIVKDLMNGHAYLDSQPVDPFSFGYDPNVKAYPFDTAKAKQLLADAGFPNGFDTPCETRTALKDQGQVVVDQLAKAGIRCNLTVDETTVHLKKVTDKTIEPIFLWTWANSTFDADGVLYSMMHSGNLYSVTSIPELDKLVDQAHTIVDQDQRLKLYQQAQQVIHDQVPLVTMYQTESLYGVRPGITWQPRPDERPDFFTATVDAK